MTKPGPKPGTPRPVVTMHHDWLPRDVPARFLPVVHRRVEGICAGYGVAAANGGTLDLLALATSAYLQAVDDVTEVHIRREDRLFEERRDDVAGRFE